MSEIDYAHDGAGTDTTLFELTTKLESESQIAHGTLMLYLSQPGEESQARIVEAHNSLSATFTELVEFTVNEDSLSTNEKIDLLSTTLYNDDIDRVNFFSYLCEEDPKSSDFSPSALHPDTMREAVARIFAANENEPDAIVAGVAGLHINFLTSDVNTFFQSEHIERVRATFEKRQERKEEFKRFSKMVLATAIGSAAVVFFAKRKS